VDIGPGCAYSDVTAHWGQSETREKNHGIEEGDQENEEEQETGGDEATFAQLRQHELDLHKAVVN
jgi:hypothetical protein